VKAVKQEPPQRGKAAAAAAAAGPGPAGKPGPRGKAARQGPGPSAAAAAGAEGGSEPAVGANPLDTAALAAAGGGGPLSPERVVELLQSRSKEALKAADMQTLVGRRIRVFWKGNDKWFTGTITVSWGCCCCCCCCCCVSLLQRAWGHPWRSIRLCQCEGTVRGLPCEALHAFIAPL
jgi:hypothetical protein